MTVAFAAAEPRTSPTANVASQPSKGGSDECQDERRLSTVHEADQRDGERFPVRGEGAQCVGANGGSHGKDHEDQDPGCHGPGHEAVSQDRGQTQQDQPRPHRVLHPCPRRGDGPGVEIQEWSSGLRKLQLDQQIPCRENNEQGPEQSGDEGQRRVLTLNR